MQLDISPNRMVSTKLVVVPLGHAYTLPRSGWTGFRIILVTKLVLLLFCIEKKLCEEMRDPKNGSSLIFVSTRISDHLFTHSSKLLELQYHMCH